MFIDTHCHLNFPQYDPDRAMVIGNAKKAGVKQFINPGVDLFSSKQAIALAQKHPGIIFAAVGFHPYEAQHNPDARLLEQFLTGSDPVIAIGECGLDYHQYKGEAAAGKKQNQKMLFEEQLLLALKYTLPVIMHVRDAYADFFDVLDSLPALPKGVIHCFSGGLQELREAQKRKFFVGVDGNVTHSKQLELIVPNIPLTMMLLETDAPYLTPVPHRGTRNEPKYIPLIAQRVAQLVGASRQEVTAQTTANAQTLFSVV
ncbi:TatD family hydrolase [Candidatus Gottesmanbacteria bacterium]|nr:TatD family hydrolase [Candidatus Gottesmanbacteria bacterium]